MKLKLSSSTKYTFHINILRIIFVLNDKEMFVKAFNVQLVTLNEVKSLALCTVREKGFIRKIYLPPNGTGPVFASNENCFRETASQSEV
jgi:hypothetical protein